MRFAAVMLVGAAAFLGTAATAAPAGSPSDVSALANRWVQLRIDYDPLSAAATGLDGVDMSRLPDRSPKALAARQAEEDRVWAALQAFSPAQIADDRTLYDVLHETVLSARQLRVCKAELWSGIGHFASKDFLRWQAEFPAAARAQPVGTPSARAAALKRWGSLPNFVDIEIANLRRGLAAGYSVPKPVVQRVITQLDGLLAPPPAESPFASPAIRDTDPAFRQAFVKLVAETMNPAVRRYRDFLSTEYLPRARDSLGLAALPDGRACYAALLRRYTTLDRPAESVFKLGQETVAEYQAEVSDLGRRLFATTTFEETVRRVGEAPENRFRSAEELLSFTRAGVARAGQKTRLLFGQWPTQPVVVEPVPEYQRGSGTTASYQRNPDPSRPGTFFLPVHDWQRNTRGNAEVAAAHEAWPGHHLQAATAISTATDSPLTQIAQYDAYVEGWGRYAERLAEEAGAYETDYARITRRVWSARGMVIDPGVHLFDWTREQAKAYAMASGRFDEQAAEALVDRLAALPAQLTAYDSGGLEIMELRANAEATLGPCFDIQQFHAQVLESGPVPLIVLQRRIRDWVAATRSSGGARCSRLPR